MCVVPDPKNDFTDRSTMIKVMEYMALGKPAFVWDGLEWVPIGTPVDGADLGVTDHPALTGRTAPDSHPIDAVTGLQTANRLVLTWNNRKCEFEVTLPPESPDEIPRVGPLLCKGIAR